MSENKSGDDGSFTKVDWDVEEAEWEPDSEKRASTTKGANRNPSTIVVQLPPDFSLVTAATATAAQGKGEAAFSLESSSYVPVSRFQALGLDVDASEENKQHDPNESLSWSVTTFEPDSARRVASSEQVFQNDESSVAASSTISGFDLISINGSTQTHCRLCSFLIKKNDTVCGGCNMALVANPNVSADEKLALYLQEQEERAAFNDILDNERKRNNLGNLPVLIRAQMLTSDILSAVESCHVTTPFERTVDASRTGFCALPEASLTVLASRFIEAAEEYVQLHPGDVAGKLVYCYTKKSDFTMTKIRQDGFHAGTVFGSVPEVAKKYSSSKFRTSSLLMPIVEHLAYDNYDVPAVQGWIVALVGCTDGQEKKVSSGTATTYYLKKRCNALPLVSIDASLMGKDIVRLLKNGLENVFRDFFETCNVYDFHNLKKQKVEEGDGMFDKVDGLNLVSLYQNDDNMEDHIEPRLHKITQLQLLIADRKHSRSHGSDHSGEKRQFIFVVANYLVLFLLIITVLVEIQVRAPNWIKSIMEDHLVTNGTHCSVRHP